MKAGIVIIEPGNTPIFDPHADPWDYYWKIAGLTFAGILNIDDQMPDVNKVTYRMFPRYSDKEIDPKTPHRCVLVCAQGPGKRQHNRTVWGKLPVSRTIMIYGETQDGYLVRIPEDEAKFYMNLYYRPERMRRKKIDGRFYNVVEYIE